MVLSMRYCINPECTARENPADAVYCQRCQTPLVIHDRYCVLKPLRRDYSSHAEVFLVEDRQDGKQKVLKTLTSKNPKAQELFVQEQTLLKSLRYPGIPRGEAAFSIDRSQGNPLPCLIMEYIEGMDLEHWLHEYGPIDQIQAVSWLRQLGDILNFIHQRNYFHRDIKPSNIMQRHSGQLVLIDFGTAREINEAAAQGQRMTILGTPGYAAPEQWQGRATPQSDFYALGMTLIRLLTGTDPDQQALQPQTWQRSLKYPIDPPLANLLDRLIELDPAKRPPSAMAILQEIDSWINAVPEPTSPQTIEQLSDQLTQIPPELLSEALPQGPSEVRSEGSSGLPHVPPKFVPPPLPIYDEPNRWHPANLAKGLLLIVGVIIAMQVGWPLLRNRGGPLLQAILAPSVCDAQLGDRLSCGEEMLVPQLQPDQEPPVEKQTGIAAFQQKNYEQAYWRLDTAWQKQRDPETLIYRNNANIRRGGTGSQATYTIAVAVPLTPADRSFNSGLEVLQGVAQAQDQAIKQGMNLEVLIADDNNSVTQAKTIAHQLVNKSKLMAVIGHDTSEVTLSVLPIYQKGRLPLISATSTSPRLSEAGQQPDHVFFRTANTAKSHTDALVRYLNARIPNQKVAIFSNQAANQTFGKSMRDALLESLQPSSLSSGSEFNLADPHFNPIQALEQVRTEGAAAIAIFPDSDPNPVTLQNAMNLIAANQGKLWVIGDNTLQQADVLQQAGDGVTKNFVVTTLWNPINSPNPAFPAEAQQYWQAEVGDKTASAYDAGQVLVTALKQNPADRQTLRNILADPSFSATGATGVIQFDGSDRRERTVVLEKVVPICSSDAHAFVPVDYGQSCYRSQQ